MLSLGSHVRIVIFFLWWWPLISGFALNEVLLRSHFFLSMVGFNLCFFPLHYLGILGLPRRVCVYDHSLLVYNNVSSFGGVLSILRGFLFLFILWESFRVQRVCVGVWGSCTLLVNLVSVPLSYHSVCAKGGFRWEA